MGPVLVLLGLAGFLLGLGNLVRPLGRLGIHQRRKAGLVIAGSMIVVILGIGLIPSPDGETPEEAAMSTIESSATTPPTTADVSTTRTTAVPVTSTLTMALPSIPGADLVFAPPAPGPSGDPGAAMPPGAETATVASITDGDTLAVTLADQGTDTVRLIGTNSPERGECFAQEAAIVLGILTPVGNRLGMTVDESDRDQYDRLLRYLWVGSMSVNEEMVRRGAAIARRYPPDTAMATRLQQAQTEARSARLGLWEPDACGPEAGTQIVVIAVEADAPGDDNDNLNAEYVLIRNDGAMGVDMTGWVLKDESASHRYDFPAGVTLGAGSSVEVHTGCGTDTETSLYWCSSGAVWNNDGDTAFILDESGNIVHSLPFVPLTTTAASTTAPQGFVGGDCHPSHTGECVPIVSDVDCVGGSGDGPYYIGRVSVVGPDEYGLDRDGDGIGCE